jgi:hypothetical protein
MKIDTDKLTTGANYLRLPLQWVGPYTNRSATVNGVELRFWYTRGKTPEWRASVADVMLARRGSGFMTPRCAKRAIRKYLSVVNAVDRARVEVVRKHLSGYGG